MADGRRLVLFDIDGTLISTRGIAKETFAEVLEEVYGRPTPARTHDFAGKTDMQIIYEVMALTGMREEEITGRMADTFDRIFTLLRPRMTRETIHVHEGVPILLDTLAAKESCTLGLLTGNMETGARLKLEPHGLDRYFGLGAYGSDARHRHELPSIAVERAASLTGYRFTEKEIVIVGDTPHDITCGAHLNVRTIAVATGGSSYEALQAYKPDALFRSLVDTREVEKAIMG